MEFDSSDILGQNALPATRDSSSLRAYLSVKNLVVLTVALSVTYVVGIRLWRRFLLWRERSYKLATRRRHGIPDEDLRPFNVAYAEAVMKAREDESKKEVKSRPSQPIPAASVTHNGPASAHSRIRQRPVPDAVRNTTVPVPGGYISRYNESMQPPAPRSANDRFSNASGVNTYVSQPNIASNVTRRPPRQSVNTDMQGGPSDNEARKRSRYTEQDDEHEAKKTRVEGEELIDGDQDAEFEEHAPKRGSKRGMQDEEDSEEMAESKKSRGKRPRKEKSSQGYQADQSMDVDHGDEEMDDITDLKPISRGKKRDRAEAGSTFGGDDDDSATEFEGDGESKLRRRRRKRRTVAKRKSEASYLRGKKREREGEDDISDDNSEETSPSKVSSRRKRGKRLSTVHHHEIERQKSDISMDESVTSSKKVREIGDEWENNGVRYKIGPNGQRLRQTLVKKARQKFVMPKDSQHPDRSANMQVCIECWLTEEEYQQARAEHLLAWQDSPKRLDDAEKLSLDTSPQGVPFPQSIPGKNLLWSASTSTTPTMSPASYSPSESGQDIPQPRRHAAYRHSIATSVGLPIAPLGASTSTAVKRISSTSRALSLTGSTNPQILSSSVNGTDSPGTPGLSDSTNASPRTPTPAKVFSKWEKQELEAKAIMKVREANRKMEKEKEAKEKAEKEAKERVEKEKAAASERLRLEKERQVKERQEKEKKEKEAAAASAAGTVPSITVTAPSTSSGTGPSTTGASFFSLAPSTTTTTTTTPKPAEAASSTSQTSTAPSNFFNLTPSTNKPAETATSTGQSTVPNFFAKPSGPLKPAPTTTFPFGVTPTATTGSSTTGAPATSQSTLFSFANPSQKPDATSSTPAAGSSTGTPLLSRMGPPAAPEQPKANSLFSFSKPETSSSTTGGSISAFPAATPIAATTSTSTPTTTNTNATGATTTPKFNFNFKPTTSTTASTTPATTTTGSTSVEKKDTPSSVFNFKPLSTSTSTTGTNTMTNVNPTAPKFTFGVPFGNTGAASGAKEPAKSAFGSTESTTASPFGSAASTSMFGNQSVTTSSPFGSTSSGAFGTTGTAFGKTNTSSAFGTTGSTASPFGATATTTSSPFGVSSTPNPFGGATTTPKTENKPFSNPAASTAGPSALGGTTTFGFNATPAGSSTTTTPTTGSGTFSFKAPTSGPQSSPFGTTNASTSTSVFGKPAETSGNSGTSSTNVFNFSAPSGSQQK